MTDGHPLTSIPSLSLKAGTSRDEINPQNVVVNWVACLNQHLEHAVSPGLAEIFIDDSWWRDFVGLSWDIATKHGRESISTYLDQSPAGFGHLEVIKTGGLQAGLVHVEGAVWVQGGFTFRTTNGSGRGLVRLINTGKNEWKAWTVFTQLERLNNQDKIDDQRLQQQYTQTPLPNGVDADKKTEPQVVIVGAGQSGVTIAAQLKHMGIKALMIDKLPRLGDFWRSRYRTVRTHTPTYGDHYPFLKFPSNWPRWLEQDKVADWIEYYGQIMELDCMLNTTVESITYDKQSRLYTVEAERAGHSIIFRPRHVILASGLFAPKPIIPTFPGEEIFRGQIYHTMYHKSASEIASLLDKSIVIIGSGTSAHDVAQDFVNHNARRVTLVQRHPIFSFSAHAAEEMLYSVWNTPGVNTEEADIMANSFPTAVARTLNVGQTIQMEEKCNGYIDGLQKAGQRLQHAKDVGYGFVDHLLVKGGKFYIDQGAHQMIVDGRIQVDFCKEGVSEFATGDVILGNGKRLPADVVVLATGYERCKANVVDLMGTEVAETLGDIGHFDKEQERIGWWRPTGFPGLWYHTGSFLWCRQFSSVLALQISAVEQGLNPEYWQNHQRDTTAIGTLVQEGESLGLKDPT